VAGERKRRSRQLTGRVVPGTLFVRAKRTVAAYRRRTSKKRGEGGGFGPGVPTNEQPLPSPETRPKRIGRKRRRAIALGAGIGVLAAIAAWVLQNNAAQHLRPDKVSVLLISLDTTRRDHLSCYGYARRTTPYIDSLAADSLLFDRCVAVSNWTLPTHASMLTGLYPTSHGAHLLKNVHWQIQVQHPSVYLMPAGALNSSCETLAEVLQKSGYRTGAVVANSVYLQRGFQFDQGFDDYDDRCFCPKCAPPSEDGTPPVPYQSAEQVADSAIRWLEKDRRRPFFLFLNFLDPHQPYFPPPPYDTRFRDEAARRLERSFTGRRDWRIELDWSRHMQQRLRADPSSVPQEVISYLCCQYDGELAYTDEHIGRILDWLRDRSLYDNTLVILTGDHGECFAEHGLLDHGFSMHEPEISVPLLVKLPHSQPKGRRGDAVQQVDILPTALRVLGLPVPAAVQGRSVLTPMQRDVFVEKYMFSDDLVRHARAIRRNDLKLIVSSDGREELYNLAEDPGELVNLVEARAQDTEVLRDALQQWQGRTRALGTPEWPSELHADTESRLRDLGYIQ
jgi:arylsulfatase A-like enzyme